MSTWPAFPATPGPKFPVTLQRNPLMLKLTFGDGYEQQTGMGLNADDEGSVQMRWDTLTQTEKDAFETALTSASGSFLSYTVPGWPVATYSCDTWKFVLGAYNLWALDVTFKREFSVA